MSGCCEDHAKDTKKKISRSKVQTEEARSFVGKYLYNLGKKELDKEKQGGKQKGCC